MAEVKGKFITLATELLKSKPRSRESAVAAVKQLTGKAPLELDPEGWYDTKVFDAVFEAIKEHESPLLAWAAIKVIGQNVYPTIDATVGLPKHLQTPLDFLKFEADGFMANHRGAGVTPRKFIKTEDRHIIVEAPSPGYNCALIEGVYDGILRMCHINTGEVKQTKCVRKGGSTCEYDIKW